MNPIPYVPFGPCVRRTPKTAVFSVCGVQPDNLGNVELFPTGALAGLRSVPSLSASASNMSLDQLWQHTSQLTAAVRRLGGATT